LQLEIAHRRHNAARNNSMLCQLIGLLGILAGATLFASNANAERRVALVVGNSGYFHTSSVGSARNDANDIAAALRRLDFQVVLGLDLEDVALAATVDRFISMLNDADVALLYYAGQEVQINGRNYLVSVNARLDNEYRLPAETIDLEDIVRQMESKAPINLVFLDAGHINPLADTLKKKLTALGRSTVIGRGMARFQPTKSNTLIAFASEPGVEAADRNDRISPFAAALLKQLTQPNRDIAAMLKVVADDVRQLTQNAQRPQLISEPANAFYFAKAENVVAQSGPADPALAAPKPPAPAQPVPPAPRSEPAVPMPPQQVARSTPTSPAPAPRTEPTQTTPTPPQQVARSTPTSPAAAEAIKPSRPAESAPAPPTQQAMVVKPPTSQSPANDVSEKNGRDCDTCPEMLDIPGGTFSMGSNDDPTERPIHSVTIRPFAMSRYPVSIGEWKSCVAAKACSYLPPGDDNLPTYNLSWNDTQKYVAWISNLTGRKYRLPTEAEWEYAARAQTKTKFWWGNELKPGTVSCKGCGGAPATDLPPKLGGFPANAFGLYDMTGNIAQWVSDCWIKNYEDAPRDGASRDQPFCRQHVVRGGSWKHDLSYARSSSRDRYDTDIRYEADGFRIVRQ
jgi:formylglycine-generating enzyme required for sulfatase activity